MVKASDCEVWGHGFNSHSVMKFFLKFMLLEYFFHKEMNSIFSIKNAF